MKKIQCLGLAAILCAGSLLAAEDWKPIQRRLPPKGGTLDESKQAPIKAKLEEAEARVNALRSKPDLAEYLPDAEIFTKAVRFAIDLGEFYGGGDVGTAEKLLATAAERLTALEKGEHPWSTKTGQTVIGYRSVVDASVQPFEIDIPKELDLSKPVPLFVWLHGRGDNDSDLHFIRGHEGMHGPIAPNTAITIYPFGRNCLGFKAAAEMDVMETIAATKRRFKIDDNRVLLMGFSMGGAGSWNVGCHYADQFAAVHAGAGYVDVARYQKVPKEKYPAWYEQKLWGVNDGPAYVRNFFNTTTVGYGGEKDAQKEAGEIMAEAFKTEGRELTLLVGPGMGHGYDGASLEKIRGLMNAAAAKGGDPHPKEVFLQTRTLRYNKMKWVSLEMLEQHWEDSRIDAQAPDTTHIILKTKNAQAVGIDSPWPFEKDAAERDIQVTIDGQPLGTKLSALQKGRVIFVKSGSTWKQESLPATAKIHGLQGPIDDAFMDSFLVVLPSGKCASPAVEKWVQFELDHFKQRWREVFRGDLPTKKDTDVTAADIEKYNLVLWGDEASNAVIRKLASGLPVKTVGNSLVIGDKKFDAATHVPLFIYPNPMSKKYVVLNSGPTFREDDDRTNSLQNPKLPDWAIIDATTAPDAKAPGKVVDADFFDESWQVRKK